MGNSKELYLIYTSMKHVNISYSVNVMLTPQFYTLKKEVLPIRFAYQAKRIAPSIFDGLIEENRQYDYMVWKEGEEWIFLAYDVEMIVSFLKTKGFVQENISKLFFTQQSADLFHKPLLFGKDKVLISLDNTVVMLPKEALDKKDNPSSIFNNTFTPKTGVALKGSYGSIFNLKQVAMFVTLFVLFALIFFIEGQRYDYGSNVEERELQELFNTYPSLQIKYVRDSILTKYKTLDNAERKKRGIVKLLSSMIFKGVVLNSFSMGEKSFKAEFYCSDNKSAAHLNELAKKAKFNVLKVSGSNNINIEGAL